MNTAVINIKVDLKTKDQVQEIAQELGLSVSALVHGFFKQLLRTKSVTFSVSEEPSDWLVNELKESARDIKSGRVSPNFSNPTDAVKWLHNPKRQYANKI